MKTKKTKKAAQTRIHPSTARALRLLLKMLRISEKELQQVVAQRGDYSADTPLDEYSPEIVNLINDADAGIVNDVWRNRIMGLLRQSSR